MDQQPAAWTPAGRAANPERRHSMGDKRGKKDKNKADKQKQKQVAKKEEQQKAKLPTKKPL